MIVALCQLQRGLGCQEPTQTQASSPSMFSRLSWSSSLPSCSSRMPSHVLDIMAAARLHSVAGVWQKWLHPYAHAHDLEPGCPLESLEDGTIKNDGGSDQSGEHQCQVKTLRLSDSQTAACRVAASGRAGRRHRSAQPRPRPSGHGRTNLVATGQWPILRCMLFAN